MRKRRIQAIAVLAAVAAALIAVSCSSGPQPPQPGTPAFYWAAANQTYKAGDYLKTQENLAQIAKTDNDFTARARPWEMVLSAGIAQGYMELANTFDDGARRNRGNPTPFRRQSNTYRGTASGAALQFTEAFHKYMEANKDKPVKLEFEYPAGSTLEPPNLSKVSQGMLMQPAEIESLEKAMIQRGVLLATARSVGAPDDAPKALEIFKKGTSEIEGKTFVLAMAASAYDISELYGPTKLDQPNRMKIVFTELKEALALFPQDKVTKELSTKVEKAAKKARIT